MVVVQVALSSVLVVSTGLLSRSLSNAWQTDLGYGARNVVVATADVPRGDLDADRAAGIFRSGRRGRPASCRASKPPDSSASLPDTPGGRRGFGFAGYQPAAGEGMEIDVNYADASYFDTMRVPLVAGRVFDSRDHAGTSRGSSSSTTCSRTGTSGGAAIGRHRDRLERPGLRDHRRRPNRTLPGLAAAAAADRVLPGRAGSRKTRMTLLTITHSPAPLAYVETIAGHHARRAANRAGHPSDDARSVYERGARGGTARHGARRQLQRDGAGAGWSASMASWRLPSRAGPGRSASGSRWGRGRRKS